MKKILSLLISGSLVCFAPLSAQEENDADDAEMPALPPSKWVGRASMDAANAARNARIRNWVIAGAVVAIGIATCVLVAKNHHKHH
ncbi:MAG TPA: hypothetical protein VLG76_00935 [Rhabdochlamydiaceae bacterium]|nr:hypothetical protein [Rhabdochlamydiaceae bacterium]